MMAEPTTKEVHGPRPTEFADELKCPICLELFEEPVLLDCSHGLCLKCAKSLVLYDGGTNVPEVTCPLCKLVTAVGGGDEAREREDELIASALKRFDIMPPRKGRVRIEDLKGCYDAFLRDGLIEGATEPKPTALHLWRAAVAKMEQQVLDKLGEKPKGGEEPEEGSPGGDNNNRAEDEVEVEGSAEGPMEKLRFKRNVVLQNLVSLVKQQKAAEAAHGITTPAAVHHVSAPVPSSPVREEEVPVAAHDWAHALSSQPGPDDAMMVVDIAPTEPQPKVEEAEQQDGGALAPHQAAATHEEAPLLLLPAADPVSGDSSAPTMPMVTDHPADAPADSTTTNPSSSNEPVPAPSTTLYYDNDGSAHFFLDGVAGAATLPPTTTTPTTTSSPSSLFPPASEEQQQQRPPDTQQQMKQSSSSSGPSQPAVPQGQQSRHLWAGHLSSVVTEPQLREAFSAFGPLEALRLLKRSAVQVLGFVHFHRTEDAIACKEALDGSNSHLGHNLKIQYQERGNNERCGTLRVHNLPAEATESDVRRTFSEFGRVRSVNINPRTLIGFVQFDNDEQATQAMTKMHDSEFMSHHLFVDYAARDRDSAPRPGQDRGGGGRDRDGPPLTQHRGPPAPRSAYDDYRSDRPDDYRGPPPSSSSNRIITLPSPRGYPPFEAFGDQNLAQLRELVDLIQYRLPASQRQTLEESLQNRELYENIQQLVGRNRRDLSAVLATLRAELGLPPRRAHQQQPPDDHRDGDYRRPLHEGRGVPLHEGRGGPRGGSRDSRDPPPSSSSSYSSGYPPREQQSRYDGGRGGGGGGGGGGGDVLDDGRGRRGGDGYDAGGGGKAPSRPPLGSPTGGWRGDDRRPYGGGRDDSSSEAGRYGQQGPPPPSSRPDELRGRERGGWDVGGPSRSPPRRRSRSSSPGGSRKRSRPMDSYPPASGGGGGRYDSRGGGGGAGGSSRSRSPRRRTDPLPPPPHYQQQHRDRPPPPSSYPPPPQHSRPTAAPLEAECEQFLQSMIGGGGGAASAPHYTAPYPAPSYSAPPAPQPPAYSSGYAAPPPPHHQPAPVEPPKPRMWLTSAQAAAYPCYEAVLTMVKDILMPFYRDGRITKDDFKRAAEETTLKVVQQLLDVGLQNRPDVPPHYRQLAYDAIRASLRI